MAAARPPAAKQCNCNLRIQPVHFNLLADHTGTEMVPIGTNFMVLEAFYDHTSAMTHLQRIWLNTEGGLITTILTPRCIYQYNNTDLDQAASAVKTTNRLKKKKRI